MRSNHLRNRRSAGGSIWGIGIEERAKDKIFLGDKGHSGIPLMDNGGVEE